MIEIDRRVGGKLSSQYIFLTKAHPLQNASSRITVNRIISIHFSYSFMKPSAFSVIILLFILNSHAGRFGHKHQKKQQQETLSEQEYNPPEPHLVNSAKVIPSYQIDSSQSSVHTPFVAHALEMKNHLHKPKTIKLHHS